jgi:actin-related protein
MSAPLIGGGTSSSTTHPHIVASCFLHFFSSTHPTPHRLSQHHVTSALSVRFITDEVNAIVLDVGTYQVKAGYAGEDTPKFVFPSAVGVGGESMASNGASAMQIDGGSGRTLRVGTHALAYRRDGMEVASPFTDGLITDWEAAEAIFQHALKDQMRLATEDHPVMLAEPTHNTKENREKMVEIMFEKYNVPGRHQRMRFFFLLRQTQTMHV